MSLISSFVLALVAGCAASSDPEGAEASAESDLSAPAAIALDVPFVAQKPELPRGCEVTSLTMLLRGAGVSIDKMKLAADIDKVPYRVNGKFGNPNTGFVGDMYNSQNPGYGVYHEPVARLAAQYLPGRIVDITNIAFDELLSKYVAQRYPVWIVTNALFHGLSSQDFTTWPTASGDVQITWQDHSVVITGYGPDFILINDPLASSPNKKLPREDFRRAWEQMGKQAITYLPDANGNGQVGTATVPVTVAAGCEVRGDHKLYCSNTANAPMHQSPAAGSPVVNTLRSTNSYFECWATGELHAGGNTTWYSTVGDDNGNRGFIPAVMMSTTSAFDANPTAYGLPKCGG